MARTKHRQRYYCVHCGHETPQWLGRCPGCETWGSLEQKPPDSRVGGAPTRAISAPVRLSEVDTKQRGRLNSGSRELDRVLGGGIVPGSVILVAGDPGIGKSTLMTQLAGRQDGTEVLYVSAEESAAQVRLRADRLGIEGRSVEVLTEPDVEAVIDVICAREPGLVIIDSVQTLVRASGTGLAGTPAQVRDCAGALVQTAKHRDIPVFLIGHVTKDGGIAGPRVLEHMVDAVLLVEGDRHHAFRIVRAVKNRFGSTNELAVFELTGEGLIDVDSPSHLFLSGRQEHVSGSVVVPAVEGTRPILVEIQALVLGPGGLPGRTTTGFELRRLQMLLAVLERRAGLALASRDVFVNVAGGIRIDDPAADLGVAAAVASAVHDKTVRDRTVLFGELGLGGEIRAVPHVERRLSEAAKMGFDQAVVPRSERNAVTAPDGLTLRPVEHLTEALDVLF